MSINYIDDYLEGIDSSKREALIRIRKLIHEEVPDLEELKSYGMPGFKYKGKYLCGLNSFKDHLSFFPTNGPIEKYRSELSDFTLSKGTIQFSLDKPIPTDLIRKIVNWRKQAIDSK